MKVKISEKYLCLAFYRANLSLANLRFLAVGSSLFILFSAKEDRAQNTFSFKEREDSSRELHFGTLSPSSLNSRGNPLPVETLGNQGLHHTFRE
ncbi:hypothetical protein AVEN_86755-1 [Araneus ventricosus]|uniref:Uncharacterized protein n=1 Tax=Araneus ventricosus TaxID=182803 RepID=A0A4Y2MIH0_ARAVE|nr:hypothetical protein AVEN_86755-1 [Araneus ventricosus]